MKVLLILFIICFLYGSLPASAQEVKTNKRVIILKLYFKNLEEPDISQLSLDLENIGSGAGIAGGGAAFGCGECNELKLPPSYFFNSFYGSVIHKNKARLFLSVNVAPNCQIRQKFTVIANQTTKLNLNCNVGLVAYYSYSSEQEN